MLENYFYYRRNHCTHNNYNTTTTTLADDVWAGQPDAALLSFLASIIANVATVAAVLIIDGEDIAVIHAAKSVALAVHQHIT